MKKREKQILTLVFILLAGIFLISLSLSISILVSADKQARKFAQLADIIRESTPDSSASRLPAKIPAQENPAADIQQEESTPAEPEFLSGCQRLKLLNEDFFGWLSIDGTKIQYPVMHTPEDPEYYLHRDFDGNDARSGVPFLAGDCFEGCGNYLIYGHNMKDKSMFSGLLSYADEDFWREHPMIHFDTVQLPGTYEVIAAFYAEAYSKDAQDVFRYYLYTDLREAERFSEYLSQVYSAALYDTGVKAQYGDGLLTLSTCSYHTENGRFVVVARQIPAAQYGGDLDP